MKRIILVAFSFICVVTLLYLGSNIYEKQYKRESKVNIIEERKILEP